MAEKILTTEYSEEMKKSYLDYSMSVITSRAIPDIRDGLKPVQRRVIYDMNELGVHSNKDDTLKSARICGDTMGKYHPHGDSSIYETLVVLAQDFKRMQPLIIGQGNFGSIEGDVPAAQRYTEAKLAKFTDDVMLMDIDKTVEFVPNYDEKLKEPIVLPARFPLFLLNGAEGIAVGMATSSPSHNLNEICDLIIAYIKKQDMSIKQMMKYVKGPDFPTGGIISNMNELLSIYETGVGKLKIRGKLQFEKGEKARDKDKLVVTEIPYTMIGDGISKFMSDVANLCESKKITDITDIYNHSSKDGIRIVFELKKDANVEKITNILYKKTRLEDTYPVNMLAIVDGRPETMNLKSIIDSYLKFQYELIEKKYNNLLQKENEKKEIQEGLIKACDLIDAIIAMLRGSKVREDAKKCLMTGQITNIHIKDKSLEKIAKTFNFTERQADAILDMKLYKLIGLEINDLKIQNKNTIEKIKEYSLILKDKNKASAVIIDDIINIKKNFGKKRKTTFENATEIEIEEEIIDLPVVYVQDKFGYCKLIDVNIYEKNKEIVDTENSYVYNAMSSNKIRIFSSSGNMYQIKLNDVPMSKIRDKGKPIDNISKFNSNTERVISCVIDNDSLVGNFYFISKMGLVKKVNADEFLTVNKCISATKLNDNDEVACVLYSKDDDFDIVIRTMNNYLLKFDSNEVPLLKKGTKGVKGITLANDDYVLEGYIVSDDLTIKIGSKNVNLKTIAKGNKGNKGIKIRG